MEDDNVEIALFVFANFILPGVAIAFATFALLRHRRSATTGRPPRIVPSDRVKALAADSTQTVEAIRRHRVETGLSYAEAKKAIVKYQLTLGR